MRGVDADAGPARAIRRRDALAAGTAALLATSVAAAGPSGSKDGWVEVEGAKLYYRDSGVSSGSVVMLAHPVSGSALVWEEQQRRLAAAGHRSIAWSRRDHAGSPTHGGAADPGAVADLLRLTTSLGIDRFHAVGSAAGGGAMLDFAVAHPDRVRTLIVANNTGGILDPAFQRRNDALRPPGFAGLPVSFRELGPLYRAADPAGVARWEALERGSRTAPLGPPPPGTLRWEDLERLPMPVMWLTGDADLYAPPPLFDEHRRRTRASELAVIGGAGHSAYWEAPDAFERHVLDFIRRRG